MNRTTTTYHSLPSLLDRLMDDHPEQALEPATHQVITTQGLRSRVRRDLEQLLNTRLTRSPLLETGVETKKSLFNYGIPDFSTLNITSGSGKQRFCLQLEQTLRTYEPRLTRIKVTILNEPDHKDRTLRFRIDAMLRSDPVPEPITFDSDLTSDDPMLRLTETSL